MRLITKKSSFHLLGIILLVILFVGLVYTFLHEAGHAMIGLLFGQSLTEPVYLGVYAVIAKINTMYFDLSLIGPNGYRSAMLHGEGYNAAEDSGLWQQNLPPGTSQVVLTSHQSPGRVSVYLEIP